MRISTQTLFDTGSARIGDLNSSLHRMHEQIATGRRILVPSDDPVASARALEVTQTQSANTQYGRNRQYAKAALSAVEGTLASVTTLLQDVKTTVIAAGNAALSDTERGFQAAELRGRFEELLGLANTRDATGNYLFSGFQTATPAFSEIAPGVVQYDGDQGQQHLQVDVSRQMAISNPGQSVFQGGGQDVFKTLGDLIALLQVPVSGQPSIDNLNAGLATANGDLDLALENVLTVRASAGARLQEIDSLNNAGDDRDQQYSQILSELQELDYTKALTQLSQQQFTLEAAQRSFVAISGLSLFNFLS